MVNTWLKKPDVGAKFERGGVINTGAQYGFAVKKGGNPELLKTINEVLSQAITDGTWTKNYVKWMGSEPATTPKATS
ncbi:MAG: hypothetical protein ACRDOV_15550 [Streptomyces sp.]